MITDLTRLNIIAQIANLFFKTNSIGKASSIARMQNKLNNETFDYLISNISQGTFYVATNIFLRYETVSNVRLICYSIKLVDLIRGTVQTNPLVRIPESAILGKDIKGFWQALAIGWDTDFIIVGTNPDNSCIIHSPDVGSYGIELGTGTSAGSGTGGNGTIVVTPLSSPPQKEITNPVSTSNIFENLDLNSLLLPGVILLAAYFFIKK